MGAESIEFMAKESKLRKDELVAEIQRKVAHLMASDEYTAEEKDEIARRFFQALEGE
jgi:hypothetical protein